MEVQLETYRTLSPPVCDGEVPNALVVEMTRQNGEGREKEGVASSANVMAGSTDDVRRVLNTARMLQVTNLLQRVGAVVLNNGEALDPSTTTAKCEHCRLTICARVRIRSQDRTHNPEYVAELLRKVGVRRMAMEKATQGADLDNEIAKWAAKLEKNEGYEVRPYSTTTTDRGAMRRVPEISAGEDL